MAVWAASCRIPAHPRRALLGDYGRGGPYGRSCAPGSTRPRHTACERWGSDRCRRSQRPGSWRSAGRCQVGPSAPGPVGRAWQVAIWCSSRAVVEDNLALLDGLAEPIAWLGRHSSSSASSSCASVRASTLLFFNRAAAIALQRLGWTRCGASSSSSCSSASHPQPWRPARSGRWGRCGCAAPGRRHPRWRSGRAAVDVHPDDRLRAVGVVGLPGSKDPGHVVHRPLLHRRDRAVECVPAS